MCGIFGFYGHPAISRDSFLEMGQEIRHRGPDGTGTHYSNHCGIGNVRLAILDPAGGDQPFYSEDKSVVLVQNGEIFNFRELKAKLQGKGYRFDTSCDTEVLLAMYMEYGESFVSQLNGMFAIAIYDSRTDVLLLFRDRIGEKPLYYHHAGGTVLFASEIKSLKRVLSLSVSYSGINSMLRLNYIPAPYTAYENVQHVMPGSYLKIGKNGIAETLWWELSEQSAREFSEDKWIEECNDLLDDAVRVRLVSDVPFGAFLSGGVDSSTVVGLMARHMSTPVRTYTIGFPDKRFDESKFAAEASRRFATRHHCEMVHYDIVEDWANFIHFVDQPHGDVSFIPMRKVSEVAARDVKMVLTGDGADELFAGYDKYSDYFESRKKEEGRDFLVSYLPQLELFSNGECKSLWQSSYWSKIDERLVDRELQKAVEAVDHFDDINKALYLDMRFLLSGNNLVKPDRMAMSYSLETRAPFLDYRMMEFAFQTPGRFKLNGADKKHMLKKAVVPLIGHDLAYRAKQMFTMPIGEWFRLQLKEYCREVLLSSESRLLSLFCRDVIEALIEDHIAGRRNNTRQVRALVSIELWLRANA